MKEDEMGKTYNTHVYGEDDKCNIFVGKLQIK
jgi:hypothetical protein